MPTVRNYTTDATYHMERALKLMPVTGEEIRPLPSTLQEITRYVEQLLSPKEQAVCDMATD